MKMGGDQHQEIEIKLALSDRDSYERLLASLEAPQQVIRQRNIFFDGPKGELLQSRVALRVREEEVFEPEADHPRRRTELTLKSSGWNDGDVHRRGEIAAELDVPAEAYEANPGALLQLDAAPIHELKRRLPNLPGLTVLGQFRNERRVHAMVLWEDANVETLPVLWEVDRTRFTDEIEEYEIEVELPDEAPVDQVAHAVRDQLREWFIDCRAEPRSKFTRFREYVLGER
jgi:uncharacterized protein YjbK